MRKLSESNEEEEQKINANDDSVFVEGYFAKVDDVNSTFKGEAKKNSAFTMHNSSISDLSLYSKLSNPIEKYLKEIPFTTGLDQMKLLQFLKVLLKLSKVTSLKVREIVDLSLPYTSDPLQNKLQQLSQLGSSIKELQKGVISYFIPKGRLESLRRDFVHRPQRFGEPLSVFIASIIEQSELLLCEMSESEIVENIVLGVTPEERSRLTFVGMPNTIRDLERMCIHTQNVRYMDQERQGRGGSHVRYGRNESYRVQNINKRREEGESAARRYVPTCNVCRKVGHEGRNCWSNNRGRGGYKSGNERNHGFPKNGRGRGDHL